MDRSKQLQFHPAESDYCWCNIAAAGTYNVTVTVNGCTSTAGSTTVVVNPVAVVTDQATSIISGGTFNVTPPVFLLEPPIHGQLRFIWAA